MANQYSNIIKFLKALNLLVSANGTTIKILVKNLHISRRSTFRLLNAFEELGFPIIEEKLKSKNEKIYRLSDTYILKLPNISIPKPFLTAEEIIYIIALLDTCKQRSLLNETIMANSITKKLKAMISVGEK